MLRNTLNRDDMMQKNIKTTHSRAAKQHQQKGAVLLEALIAIVIFSFGILALAGLQGAMMKGASDATYRAEAAYVVQQAYGEMLSNPVALGGNNVKPVANLPNGFLSTALLTEGRYQFIVTWQTPGENVHTYEAVTSVFTAR
jgi:type IV pilus assembly protein PilV